MEFVMFVSMLLFTGLCTLIVVVAMLNVNRQDGSEPASSAQQQSTDEQSGGA